MNEVSTRLEVLKLPEEKNLILKSLGSDSLFDIKKKRKQNQQYPRDWQKTKKVTGVYDMILLKAVLNSKKVKQNLFKT